MPGEPRGGCDPRSRLTREKYFCLRPQPLERWLWSKRIPASAERVFWLHWQEGMQRGDWCSEIPLSRVARECDLDVSTVTRAYQVLTRLHCVRRTDQGRDPANPFQQATALTEVRIPRELLAELNRYPDRRANSNPSHQKGQGRGIEAATAQGARNEALAEMDRRADSEPRESGELIVAQWVTNEPGGAVDGTRALMAKAESRAAASDHVAVSQAVSEEGIEALVREDDDSLECSDPLSGLKGRERVRAIAELVDSLSAAERRAYQEALRMHQSTMAFDAQSTVPAAAQSTIRRLLAAMCQVHCEKEGCARSGASGLAPARSSRPRALSAFEISRLSRQLQTATSVAGSPELMRQVVWSVEVGALKRFDIRHAIHIALKKIREGRWTRPHRMPPNWVRALSTAPAPETCGFA